MLASLPDPTMTFEIWSWSADSTRLAGIRHLADGSHAGVGVYDVAGSRRLVALTPPPSRA